MGRNDEISTEVNIWAPTRPVVLVIGADGETQVDLSDALAPSYRVIFAKDPDEGCEAAGRRRPDMILCIIGSEGEGALAPVQAMRTRAETAETPIVALAAGPDETLRLDLFRAGVRAVVTGASTVAELRACMANIIDHEREFTSRLRDSQLRFESVFELAGVGIALVGTDGRWLRVNRKLCEILGFSEEDLLARDFQSITHPDDLGAGLDLLRRTLAGEISHYSMEKRYLRSDGGVVWGNLTVALARNAGSSQGWFISVVEDISERRQAEADRRIAAVAFEGGDGMMITDARGAILKVNTAFTNITGYAPHEAVGQSSRLLCSGRHEPEFFRAMWEAISHEGQWQGRIWNRRKDGGVYSGWLSVAAIRDDTGTITHYLANYSDVREPHEAERRIVELAFYDPLTSLPNRRLLLDRLANALAVSDRAGFGAMLLLDLDNFKSLNDTRGHPVGDLLLVEVARRLRRVLRETDTAARLGGDEFVVLLQQLGHHDLRAAADAEQVAEKLRLALSAPIMLNGQPYSITSSTGITLFRGGDADADELMKQADLALYQAKAAGRGQIRFFNEAMQAASDLRAELETGLRRALAEGELTLHYQPQVDLSGRIQGVEALLRWLPDGRPPIPPDVFIPIAEETGLILPIGQWVLRAACRQLALWRDDPDLGHVTVALNVSARQFRQPDFAAQVRQAVADTGADATRLTLELTESALLDDLEQASRSMTAIKRLGASFSMDDFGAGHSSLTNLRRLPIDELKIDRTLVRAITLDADGGAVVEAIVALGRSLRLRIIAEGVETEAQHALLRGYQCETFQGYLFGRPATASDIETLARAGRRGPRTGPPEPAAPCPHEAQEA